MIKTNLLYLLIIGGFQDVLKNMPLSVIFNYRLFDF